MPNFMFLNKEKEYNALDRYQCLNILAVYRMGPWKLWILRTYWDRLRIVKKTGRYFGPPFQEYRGVTQVDNFFPTVFNVVVDAVIRHWTMVVVLTEAGAEGLGETFQELAALLYANSMLVASPWTERLQRAFNALTYIFDWVGIYINV